MRQCQHTGHPPHGAIGLWFARPARQHTHTPTHQATTAPPSHREPVSLPHPGVRRMPTAHFLHTRQRCPLRWLPHRRPARRTPTQGHRQTPQTNTSHKHRSPALAHGLGCHMRGCRMRARHLHRASGLPHRRAHAHGPMAAPAPLHPGPVPCGRSPLPYTALYSPLSLGTAPARHSARWASTRSACPWDRPAAPPVGHRPADQLARASGPGLCWGLWVLWPWGVPPAAGIAPPRLFWRQPGPQNAKDRNILLLGYFYLTPKD